MRIALLTPTFLPNVGGAEFVVHSLALEWGKQGHDVHVINRVTDEATHPDATYTAARFKELRGAARFGHHRFPFRGYTARDIKRLIDDFRPDFISAHMGYPMGMWLAGMRLTCPWVVTCHGRELTKFDWGFRNVYGIDAPLRDALDASTGAIAISSHARLLMEELGVRQEKILDIPNGVDLARFRRDVDFDLRASLGLASDAFVVLSVGREHPQKAYATGLRAFASVAAQAPHAHLVMLGRGTDANAPLAEELGLTGRVTLHSGLHGDDLVGAYQQADLFFSSSIWEMMPLVVLEAMAAGLPAVVTNVSGSQDLVVPELNGLVVEPDDPDAMSEALLRLIRDDSLRSQCTAGMRRRSEEYSWDRVSRRYLEAAGVAS